MISGSCTTTTQNHTFRKQQQNFLKTNLWPCSHILHKAVTSHPATSCCFHTWRSNCEVNSFRLAQKFNQPSKTSWSQYPWPNFKKTLLVKWLQRMRQCIASEGRYFEKEKAQDTLKNHSDEGWMSLYFYFVFFVNKCCCLNVCRVKCTCLFSSRCSSAVIYTSAHIRLETE